MNDAMYSKTCFLFFIASILTIKEVSAISCYTCKSTSSNFDEDCYYGRENNISCISCDSSQNSCWSKVVNNRDGTYDVERDCYSESTGKDYFWNTVSTKCNWDLCNLATPHLTPDIFCYSCSSAPDNYDDDCYYGRQNASFTKCQGTCQSEVRNNFDGTFNVSRDCYHYSKLLSNDVPIYWGTYCDYNWCNNAIPHLVTPAPSTVSSVPRNKLATCSPSPTTEPNSGSITSLFISNGLTGKQNALVLIGATLIYWGIFP